MRLFYAVLLLSALLVGCAAGCTVGPAANRAAREGRNPEPGAPGVPEPPQEKEPQPDPAPPHGALTITSTHPTGLPDVCCLAELPTGDLLIGTGATGAIHLLDPTTGHITDLGTLSGVAYAPDRTLLALTVESADPDARGLFAYYTEGDTATIARYGYDDEGNVAYTASTLVSELPQPEPAATTSTAPPALAFGPDGMLYAGTANGEILRMTSIGWVPDDNPSPGSFTYATAPGGGVTGLAWDASERLWMATPAHVTAVAAAVPLATWPPGERVAGLAYTPASGSLWLSANASANASGLWRVPLDGGVGLTGPPERFPLEEPPVALLPSARDGSGLWVLTSAGAVVKATVS
jgi:glucose/arabinose dehydrogenase